jgi:molybdenum cofactor synthesis domain-containing protein
MDGFAIVSRDTEKASTKSPVILNVAGAVVLGSKPRGVLRSGQAYRVSTGSFLPRGADAVLPIEDVSVTGNRIGVTAPVPRGLFVFETGGDVRKHQVMIESGRPVRAQEVGLTVSIGIGAIEVFRRPRVAILATGSELTESQTDVGARVRNSHTHVFMRLAEESGCIALSLGIAPDVRKEITSRIEKGLADADVVFTTGGTSVGRMDLLDEVVQGLRPAAMFHGIRMDRGRVTGVAVVRGKPVVMMPGPAQGAMNAFVLFGLPILRKLSGRVGGDIMVRAKLKTRWEARKRFPAFTKVVYVRLERGPKGPVAEPVAGETESMTILTKSNAFLVLPERTTALKAGSEVDALLMPGFSFV